MYRLLVVLFPALTLMSAVAFCAESVEQQKRLNEECESFGASANVAMRASDWPSLEKISRRGIDACRIAGDPPFSIVSHFKNLGDALVAQGRFKDALTISEKCIEIYYSSPICHFNKAIALLKLNRKGDAGEAKRIAISVCNSMIERDAKNQPGKDEFFINMYKYAQEEAQIVLMKFQSDFVK